MGRAGLSGIRGTGTLFSIRGAICREGRMSGLRSISGLIRSRTWATLWSFGGLWLNLAFYLFLIYC